MKECPVCKAKNQNDALFCTECGSSLKDTAAAGGWDATADTPSYGEASRKGSNIFVDQSESIISTIGSNYLQNFLSGDRVKKGIGVLTQKRFYYKGKNFSGAGKNIKSAEEEGVVSIEDITFTKFTYVRYTGLLVAAIILTVFVISAPAAIVFYILYFTKRQSLFLISFPGGGFSFNIRWYPISDIRDFQRQLHLLKDHIKESAEI